MWSVPLRVSCPGPVLRLACLGGGGPVPVPPYLAWGCGGGGWASPGGFPRPRESRKSAMYPALRVGLCAVHAQSTRPGSGLGRGLGGVRWIAD